MHLLRHRTQLCMCAKQIIEIDIPPKLQILLHECMEARPNISFVSLALVILRNELLDMLLESVTIPPRYLQFLTELQELVRERWFDSQEGLQLQSILRSKEFGDGGKEFVEDCHDDDLRWSCAAIN
jgi:hypothetical protein